MLKKNIFFLFLLFASGAAVHAQSLDFIGLKNVRFGMASSEMPDKTIIIDSTSAYQDTAIYMRNTRCQVYFRQQQDFALSGFTASRIEYEFCDNELAYVFVYVNGNAEIDKAVTELQKTFRKLGCKGKPTSSCTMMDASAKGMRVIVNIDRKTQTMSFVIIPKKSRK